MERWASPPVLSMREHKRVAGEDARRSMIVIATSRNYSEIPMQTDA
jgi:hypothetical protein